MFGFFKKKSAGETVTYKLGGMHCTSCSMNIDGALEDVDGVLEAKTKYAQSTTEIRFDPKKVTEKTLQKTILDLGYTVDHESSSVT